MQSFAKITAVLLAALMLSFTVPAYAQDPTPDVAETYERFVLPEGRRCVSEGVTYACFTVEEYTQLLDMDVEASLLRTERNRLLERWTEENRLRLVAENRPDLGSWVAWALVAVEAVIVGVLAGVLVAE